jgi:hypothetical protein
VGKRLKLEKGTYGWPAMMRLTTAAAYLKMSSAAYQREVFTGVMPDPVRFRGKEAWSKKQIDEAIDRLVGNVKPGSDWRSRSPVYANSE